MKFGEWLRLARKTARLTQGEVAKRAGISTSYVSTLERNAGHPITEAEPQPKLEVVDSIARAVGVEIDEARLAAGYAPQSTAPPKPRNVAEFIHALERLGLDFGTLSGRWDVIERYTPEEFQDLIERIQADIQLDVEQKVRRYLK